jgi:threonine dehydratase
MHEPTLDTVLAVRDVVARHTLRTPLLRSDWLSDRTGASVTLKCESLQRTGSFKIRGAIAALHTLGERERRAGVFTASAGNHGRGLAHAARQFGVPCTVVVPEGCPAVKAEGMQSAGARVVVAPHAGFDDAQAWALDHRAELGARFVSAYDDPAVIAGNGGTLALEILEAVGEPDLILAPCGGGGLTTGLGLVTRERAPRTRVVGVNAEASPGMWLSRRDGRPHLRVESGPTWAEGIEGGVGALTFSLSARLLDDIVLASEAGIRNAVGQTLLQQRLVIEGSAAAAVAAVLEGRVAVPPGARVVVILTGSNIDPDRLAAALGPPPSAAS